jgi:pSer/pThr/pTyr-binding forkhead associated (FHA) protein
MARLVLKHESQVLREIPLANVPLTIGRALDNNLRIDNLAVSDHHARLCFENEEIVIEDLGSLNGTYVNGLRITRTTLRNGDNIQIGQHLLGVDTIQDASATIEDSASGGPKAAGLPKTNWTAKFDVAHAPVLRVLRGQTNQREYILLGKLTVIGSSKIAAVRMQGWFAPVVGAQINHHQDGYYLGRGDTVPKLNGQPIQSWTLLHDGDIIQVGRVQLQFSHGPA